MAQLDNAKIVEEFGNRSCVMYCPYNVPWPLDTRDFLWFQHWESRTTGEETIYGFSVTRPDVPEKKGHVRGVIFDSGYCIRPTSDNTCRMSYIVCIDPMGWVPAWANTKTAEQAYTLAFTKAHFDAHPITVSSKPVEQSSPAPAADAPASSGQAVSSEQSPAAPSGENPASEAVPAAGDASKTAEETAVAN